MKEENIRKYAELMKELSLTGMEITEDGTTVRLERMPAPEPVRMVSVNDSAALKDFDTNTAARIRMEIENENIPVIQQLEADGKALKADFVQKQADAQAAQTEINNTYAAYLGAKNATPEKIDDMITIIEEGRASTIMQALDIINGEIK